MSAAVAAACVELDKPEARLRGASMMRSQTGWAGRVLAPVERPARFYEYCFVECLHQQVPRGY
jgi:hypothetical protein